MLTVIKDEKDLKVIKKRNEISDQSLIIKD